MKSLLSHSLVVRLAMLLLALAPVFSACNSETDAVREAREHEEEYKKIDDALIQEYFKRHGITSNDYVRTDEGIYLVNVQEGQGSPIVAGNVVQVKYIGKFIRKEYEDVVFDKSYGNRTLCECTEVIVGRNSVIQGWEKALLRMKLNDQKRVFIPSYLAYGQLGNASIPGDEPLQFDMLISKVQ